jgi:flagellar biosynthesis chaperone FliJ
VKGNFVLATVLRVRKLQEEMARAEVAAAQAGGHRARTEHARREALLAGRPAPGTAQSAQWLAAVAGNLALAADAYAAREAVVAADEATESAMGRWAEASSARKGIDRLAERHAEAVRRDQDRRAQQESDDRAGADHHARRRDDLAGEES